MNALRVCPGVLHRAHPLQAVMGAEVVVVLQPTLGYLPDLVQRVEQVRIQHMLPEGAVEALNEGILRRLARLDVDELNALHPAPLLRQRGNELRPVVHPDALWLLPSPYQVIQHPHHPIALQGEVHLDVQGLPVIVVHHVKERNFLPLARASLIKSTDQVWFASSGTCSGSFTRSGSRFLAFLLILSPMFL